MASLMEHMVSLVIPNYATTHENVALMEQALKSLEYGRPDEVIVVDDGSPLGCDYSLADVVIKLDTHQGYTVATNTGLKAASGDIIIIGNSDLTFQPGWLEGMLLPLEQGCDVSSIVTADQGYETRDEITIGDRFGSCWAITRKVLDEVGLLDESLGRGYFTDTDYYMRLKEGNYRVGKNWNALVEHEGSAVFKAIDPENKSYYESMERFKKKYNGLVI